MMAAAAAGPPASVSSAAARSTPLSRLSRSLRTPMSPVEHTITSIGATSRTAAACSAVACVIWKPAAPV